MSTVGVIPARYNSIRYPGKAIADLYGKPMVYWVYHMAQSLPLIDKLVVATDDKRIEAVCRDYGMNVILTSGDHTTPTSRLYEVSMKIKADIYLFIGTDEPLLTRESVEKVLIQAKSENSLYVVHAMTPIHSEKDIQDTSNIKIVTDNDGFAIYTSRSRIPFENNKIKIPYMKFVGLGAYSYDALKFFNDTSQGSLEINENCDLLRFIENRKLVKMVDINQDTISVDTPEDMMRVNQILSEKMGDL